MQRARPWPEADLLFSRDDGWLGTDDAYSVPLDGDRTLWLFGDTFLGDRAAGRAAAGFVSNTVAVQIGLDPSTATLTRWPLDPSSGPMFPVDHAVDGAAPGEWLWPLDGVRLGGSLLVFLMRVRSTRPDLPRGADAWAAEGSLGFFSVVGVAARLVDDLDRPLAEWRPRAVAMPESGDAALGTALLAVDDHLLAWAHRDGHALLVRWPLAAAAAGRLDPVEWWAGTGWRDHVDAAVPVVTGVPTEFTVHRDGGGRFVLTCVGDPVGRSVVEQRTSPTPHGPWSAPYDVATPSEAGRDGTICYAGKAHPELLGADQVLTYASIRLTRADTLADDSVYRPRFLRLDAAGPDMS